MDIGKYIDDNYTQDDNGYISKTPYKQLDRCLHEKNIVRVANYVRCSSDEQKKNGYTIDDQLNLLADFANEYSLVNAGNYVDEGISATLEISKRKDLARLIEDAKKGKFDIVVFKCIDRFFRNVGEYYECQKQLQKAGVTWISIEEADLDPNDTDAVFKINIYLTMAEYEARKTSKRIRFNNKNRIKNKQVVCGEQCFLFPWKVVGEKRNRHLERNMERADELFDILNHFETHGSKASTLRYYNATYGASMSMDTLTNLLNDTLLYGVYKGVPEYVEPFITKERFDAIQAILKRNYKRGEVNGRVFLFSGLIKCRCCGRKLSGNYIKNRTASSTYQYRCNTYRVERTCPNNQTISEGKIEKALLENLGRYMHDEIVRVDAVKDNNEKKAKKPDTAAIKDEMSRLNTMFRKRRISEEEYDKEYIALERKLAMIEEEPLEEERNVEGLRQLLSTDYIGLYNQLDRFHKQAFWRKLIKEFKLGEDRKPIDDSIIFF